MLPKDIYIFVHHKVVSDFPFQIMTSIPQIFLISIFTKQTLISPTTQSQLFVSERTGLYGAVILAVYSKADNPLQNTELSTNI